MQSLVWMGLAVAAGICVSGVALIVRGARAQMKTRRRTQKLNRWVREENAAQDRNRPRPSQRLFSS
jgi:MFS superfamily sulfate permease-like transporter